MRRASAATPDLKGPFTRYGVDFAISTAGPQARRHIPTARTTATLKSLSLAYDREGKPLNFVVTKGDVNLDPRLYASAAEGRPPDPQGDRRTRRSMCILRTGIYDFSSSTAGTLGVPLTDAAVPPAK